MSNFLWTVIFRICPISRVPRRQHIPAFNQLQRNLSANNTRITEHNTRSIYGRPKLSLIVPRNSGNRANPENDSPSLKNKKFSTKFDDLGVTIMRKRCSIQQGEKTTTVTVDQSKVLKIDCTVFLATLYTEMAVNILTR